MRKLMTVIAAVGLLVIIAQAAVVQAQDVKVSEYAQIEKSRVNLRAEIGTSSEIIGTLCAGEKYPIILQAQHWVKIRHSSLGAGWVYRPLVSICAETTFVQSSTGSQTQQSATANVVNTQENKHLAIYIMLILLTIGLVASLFMVSHHDQYPLMHHH